LCLIGEFHFDRRNGSFSPQRHASGGAEHSDEGNPGPRRLQGIVAAEEAMCTSLGGVARGFR
jgi:hypothetical protein